MQRGPMRPLMTGCILYLLLMAVLFLLSDFLYVQIALVLFLILGLSVCAYLAGIKRIVLPRILSSRNFCIGLVVAVVLASVGVFSVMHNYRALQVSEETAVTVSGVVDRVYYATDSGASFLLDLDRVNGKRQGGKIRVQSTGFDAYANAGERITCTVVLGCEEQMEDYQDNLLYAFPDGIYAYAEVRDGIERQGKTVSFSGMCDGIAAWCKQRFYRYLPEDAAELCIGVLLGDKTVLSPEVRRDFRRVGASHILAVSGMHFSILISGLLFALVKMGVPMKLRYTAALVFIVLYIGIIGFSPSVVRAGIMWVLVCIARLIYEQTDALTSLFFAAAIMCFVTPYAVFDIGFLLSVTASCGLILLIPPLNIKVRRIPFFRTTFGKPLCSIVELIAVTFAASIFTMPITLSVFGELSLIAPIANLLLHIPITVLMYIGPLLILLSLLSFVPPIAWILHFFAGVLRGDAALICDLVGWMSHIRHVLIGVRYVFAVVLLAVFLIGFLLLFRKTRNLLWAYPVYGVFLLSLFLSIQIYAYLHQGEVAVTYDVHRKNDIVTVVADGRGMMIDASDGTYTNTKLAWEQLSVQNITEVDVFLLTHCHTRHVHTLARLAQDTVVKTVVMPVPLTEEEEEITSALREIAIHAGIGVQMYHRGEDDIMFGAAAISPYPLTYLDRSVQPLLGWSVSAGEETLVYLGSSAFETDDHDLFVKMRENTLANCKVLLLGIHGPLYKTSLPLLSELLPHDTAIVCADDTVRSYLHPEDAASHFVYSIARDGPVRVILNGEN